MPGHGAYRLNVDGSDFFYDSVDGLRLYCRIYPARTLPAPPNHDVGVPVLCVPGLTRNSRDFTALATHLCARGEVLTVDLRGRGRSAWDPDSSHYHLPVYLGDMHSLLEARGLERVLVVGTSLGALIGMGMAARHPQRIAGLVLNDAGPEFDSAGLRRVAGYAGKLPPVTTWAEAATQAKRVYEVALPGQSDAEWLDYARLSYRENAAGVPVPDMDPKIGDAFKNPGTAPADLWPMYAAIAGVPMLVLRGAHSDLLSAATVARMVREKPQVRHVEVANRGHTPLLNETECLTAIDAFVARYGRESKPP